MNSVIFHGNIVRSICSSRIGGFEVQILALKSIDNLIEIKAYFLREYKKAMAVYIEQDFKPINPNVG